MRENEQGDDRKQGTRPACEGKGAEQAAAGGQLEGIVFQSVLERQ
jgi:hypothetical protein